MKWENQNLTQLSVSVCDNVSTAEFYFKSQGQIEYSS